MNAVSDTQQSSMPQYSRIVIKLGTTLLTGGTSTLDEKRMSDIVRQVAVLHNRGVETLVVSSGAVAAGRSKLGQIKKIKGLPLRQVMASVGQSRLMSIYEKLFEPYGIILAQALLSRGDLYERVGYLNARNTLLALLELGVIGIINENDVVAVDELHEGRFGDNDNLSAMVANLVDADLLLILSDISGLYSDDPNLNPDARLIPVVDKITHEIETMVGETVGNQGTGGMITKVEAARIATSCGITVIIASGHEPDVITKVVQGENIGTRFLPLTGPLDSRERWILSGLSTKGKLVVDDGAATALQKQKGSLLAAGIVAVENSFERGDLVDIHNMEKKKIGSGISNYSSKDITLIKGVHSDKIADLLGHDYGSEVVHRNNLVVL